MSNLVLVNQGLAALRATPAALPSASTVAPGAVVLSTSGPERSDLQGMVALAGLAVFGAGFGVGWWARRA